MSNDKYAKTRRIQSLIKKEMKQIIRDPSSIIIAIILPLILLFLFGFGISLELKNISIGVVIQKESSESNSLLYAFKGNPYFNVITAKNKKLLEPLLVSGKIDAILTIPADFDKQLYNRSNGPIQVIIRGTDANTGELVLNYIEGAWENWITQKDIEHNGKSQPTPIIVEPRVWFNQQIKSRVALLPGSIAVIITLIGTMLTSLVVAREWERGTMEALLATPITKGEFLLGKIIPYYILGISATILVTIVSKWIMDVPLRGSMWVLIVVSSAFLLYALGLGLLISSITRNQFIATQTSLIVGFLPALILSGLVFEINSMPAPIRCLTYIFAPRYFVSSLRTLFLVGNVWKVIIPDTIAMSSFGITLIILTLKKTKKIIE